MEKLKGVLEECGSGLEYVAKAVVCLVDMNYFSAFNEVYAQYMGEHRPARSCLAVKELPANEIVKVEVVVLKKMRLSKIRFDMSNWRNGL